MTSRDYNEILDYMMYKVIPPRYYNKHGRKQWARKCRPYTLRVRHESVRHAEIMRYAESMSETCNTESKRHAILSNSTLGPFHRDLETQYLKTDLFPSLFTNYYFYVYYRIKMDPDCVLIYIIIREQSVILQLI